MVRREVGIAERHHLRLVPEQLLDRAEIDARHHQPAAKCGGDRASGTPMRLRLSAGRNTRPRNCGHPAGSHRSRSETPTHSSCGLGGRARAARAVTVGRSSDSAGGLELTAGIFRNAETVAFLIPGETGILGGLTAGNGVGAHPMYTQPSCRLSWREDRTTGGVYQAAAE